MKKTLLSVIAGLAVINAASAVPSPADRKALCEKHPDKYVWVEKTEACVPINPCTSNNQEVQSAYCWDTVLFPYDTSKRDLVVERLAEKKLSTTVKSIQELPDLYFAAFTTDGNYLVGKRTDQKQMTMEVAVTNAAFVYGDGGAFFTGGDVPSYYAGGGVSIEHEKNVVLANVYSPEECIDIKDFASLLFEDLIEGKYDEKAGNCRIEWD